MNVLYLKYALEIAKTGSINKAAENLYMAQPNLSRAIKELENSLGVSIFERTSKGMIPTQEGETLLAHAEEILRRVDEVESMFRDGKVSKIAFSLSAPRSFYISRAFSFFSTSLAKDRQMELIYRETDAQETLANVFHSECKLGILRYDMKHDNHFQRIFEEKGLRYEMIAEFSGSVLLSKSHPLAMRDRVSLEELSAYTELCYTDAQIPSFPSGDPRKNSREDEAERRIFVCDRASCIDLLAADLAAFHICEPISPYLAERWGLRQIEVAGSEILCKDVLVYRKDYKLTKYDNAFITELCNAKRACIKPRF